MWWLKELFTCFRFLAVSGDRKVFESKRVYELFIPLVLSATIFAIYVAFPSAFVEGFLGRFLAHVFQFMVFVVPFHLAALAAFATFERAGLDDKVTGTNAEVRIWSNPENDYIWETLSLRQYASLLFGYLCAIGIIFIIGYVFIVNLNFHIILGGGYPLAYFVALFLSLFFVLHYAVLSAYSITFLFDKINRIGGDRRKSK